MRLTLSLILLLVISASGFADLVSDTRIALQQGDFNAAVQLVQSNRQYGITPEWIEALSWLGRGALNAGHYDTALTYSRQTMEYVAQQLKSRRVDAEPHLPLALGAAIEIRAQATAAKGDRASAISFLQEELAKYGTTSVGTRIRKNLNLLSLEGKPAPALKETTYLPGPKPVPLSSLRGKPVVLFFWAHWCPDCKIEGPILAQLTQEYASKGLTVIAPTQLYGFVGSGEQAPAAEEMKYIERVRAQYYPFLEQVACPLSADNFRVYGASTTPTLVLLDEKGAVQMYHPGRMTAEELRAAIDKIAQ